MMTSHVTSVDASSLYRYRFEILDVTCNMVTRFVGKSEGVSNVFLRHQRGRGKPPPPTNRALGFILICVSPTYDRS